MKLRQFNRFLSLEYLNRYRFMFLLIIGLIMALVAWFLSYNGAFNPEWRPSVCTYKNTTYVLKNKTINAYIYANTTNCDNAVKWDYYYHSRNTNMTQFKKFAKKQNKVEANHGTFDCTVYKCRYYSHKSNDDVANFEVYMIISSGFVLFFIFAMFFCLWTPCRRFHKETEQFEPLKNDDKI